MKRHIATVFALAWVGAGQCAPFADPTRPPNLAPASEAAVAGGPRLESVLIAPDRRIAIISGQRVQMGDRFGGGHVVRITDTEVVIRSGQATQTLRLFPEVDKQQRARRETRTPR
jgi:MSHA biogenesis protein MshK